MICKICSGVPLALWGHRNIIKIIMICCLYRSIFHHHLTAFATASPFFFAIQSSMFPMFGLHDVHSTAFASNCFRTFVHKFPLPGLKPRATSSHLMITILKSIKFSTLYLVHGRNGQYGERMFIFILCLHIIWPKYSNTSQPELSRECPRFGAVRSEVPGMYTPSATITTNCIERAVPAACATHTLSDLR